MVDLKQAMTIKLKYIIESPNLILDTECVHEQKTFHKILFSLYSHFQLYIKLIEPTDLIPLYSRLKLQWPKTLGLLRLHSTI